jgi:hypothetical protein
MEALKLELEKERKRKLELEARTKELEAKQKELSDALVQTTLKCKHEEALRKDAECSSKIYEREFHYMQDEVIRTKRLSDNADNISLMEKLQQRCMKRMYMKMVQPPKNATRKELYDTSDTWIPLEIPEVYENETEGVDINDDDEVVFSITGTQPGGDHALGDFMVYKEMTFDKLHNALHDYGFYIRNARGEILHNKYITTRRAFLDAIDALA